MDASDFTVGMLPNGNIDIVMSDNDTSYAMNGDVTNQFMDPRVLNQADDVDLVDPSLAITIEDHVSPSEPPLLQDLIVNPRTSSLPTGCCYDDRMKLHANSDYTEGDHHPEDPRRIEAIMKGFKDAQLIFTGSDEELVRVLKESPSQWMWRIMAREATAEEICLCHTASHFESVRRLSLMTPADLRHMSRETDLGRKSLYINNLTFESALVSAGGAIETCKNVVAGNVKNAIAVIRPPGHHAEHDDSMGFCIFNNVPIAARVCMADYPEICRKVLILDWDVHHGNGIQNIFYDDPNVLYISLHVYQNGDFYPGRPDIEGIPDGGLDKCGVGRGLGKNINIGWADQGVGDGEYMAAFQRIVMPIAHEFDPDLVIISAGFDAAVGDTLGGCFVTPGCYSHMTHMLMSLAGGKVAVCLEGGYNLKAISRSALAVAKTLMGEPPERIDLPPVNIEATLVLANVQRIQAEFWECMRPGIVNAKEVRSQATERVSRMLRTAQTSQLTNTHNMIPIYVQRTGLSVSFENQVLVTPDLHLAKKILLIIHDPPGLVGNPDPHNHAIDLHNTFVSTTLSPYIDWAIANSFGVIDINIPKHIPTPTSDPDTDPHAHRASEGMLGMQMKELLCYLWDNYIELNEKACLVLMGVGDAYLGIKQLLVERNAKDKIPGIISFVSGSLRPVKSEADPLLSAWYKENSLIYVTPDHACWTDEDSSRKVRKKRFGTVVKGDVDGVGGMLERYQPEAEEYITAKVRAWEAEYVDMSGEEMEYPENPEHMSGYVRLTQETEAAPETPWVPNGNRTEPFLAPSVLD